MSPFAWNSFWSFRSGPNPARRDLLLLVAAALLLFGAGMGLRHPWPADEPRFALIALEMVETGEWLFPHRASQLYPDKPPLFMWAIAGFYLLTGSLKLAFLLPSLLAGVGTVVLVYDLGRRLWHRRVGLAAALVLLTVVQFALQAKTAQIDASVSFLTTLGLYGLCRHLLLGPAWNWWYLGCAAMGLGVITKGVGFLPLLVLLPWAYGKYRGWRHLPELGSWGWRGVAGIGVLLAAIGLWLVPMLLAAHQSGDPDLLAYRNDILWGQTAERYTAFVGHQQPFWYYPAEVVPSLWMPVALFLPWLVPAWGRRSRRRDGRYLLLLGFIVAVLVFFSFSSGKRGVYVLPAVPALALACGPLLAARLDRLRGVHRAALGLVIFLGSIFGLAGVLGLAGAEVVADLPQKAGFEPWSFLLALAAAALVCALGGLGGRGVPALGSFFFVTWLLYSLWGYPLLDSMRSSSRFMTLVSERLDENEELGMLGWKEQMMLHADRPVTHWGYYKDEHTTELTEARVEASARWLAGVPTGVLLVPARWLEPCFDAEAGEFLGTWHRLDWYLIRPDGITAACPGHGTGDGNAVPRYRTDWMAESKWTRSRGVGDG